VSEYLKCPNCEAPIESTFERCPVCEETLSAPITFERGTGVHTASGVDSFRLRWQRNDTEQNRGLVGPWNGDATVSDIVAALQQNDALRAEVLKALRLVPLADVISDYKRMAAQVQETADEILAECDEAEGSVQG